MNTWVIVIERNKSLSLDREEKKQDPRRDHETQLPENLER